MRYVLAEPNTPGTFVLRDTDEPAAGPSEVLVAVKVVSLNPGEIRYAKQGKIPRPGWDVAGEVLAAPAAAGPSLATGARVVGRMPSGGWAERVSVPIRNLAPIPESVSLEDAATLPVAGLTALSMLGRAGQLVGGRVLVVGASGSVGYYSCAVAKLSGAHVVGTVRNPDRADFVKQAGADEVVVATDLSAAASKGPYDCIVDTVGGAAMEQAVGQLAVNGLYIVCIALTPVTLTDPAVLLARNARVQIFGGQVEEKWSPPAAGLKRLLACLADGRIKAPVEERHSWTKVAEAAARLEQRKVTGKIVLTVD